MLKLITGRQMIARGGSSSSRLAVKALNRSIAAVSRSPHNVNFPQIRTSSSYSFFTQVKNAFTNTTTITIPPATTTACHRNFSSSIIKTKIKELNELSSRNEWEELEKWLVYETTFHPELTELLYTQAVAASLDGRNIKMAGNFYTALASYLDNRLPENAGLLYTHLRYFKKTRKFPELLALYASTTTSLSNKSHVLALRAMNKLGKYDIVIKTLDALLVEKQPTVETQLQFMLAQGISASISLQAFEKALSYINMITSSENITTYLEQDPVPLPTLEWIYIYSLIQSIKLQCKNSFIQNLINALKEERVISLSGLSVLSKTFITTERYQDFIELYDSAVVAADVGSSKELPLDLRYTGMLYSALIQSYQKTKQNTEAIQVLDSLISESNSVVSFTALVYGCKAAAELGLVDTVQAYRRFATEFLNREINASTAVLAAVNSEDLNSALVFHKEFKSTFRNSYGNVLGRLLSALESEGCYEEVFQIYKEYEEKKTPTWNMMEAVIKAKAAIGKSEEAYNLYQDMCRRGYRDFNHSLFKILSQ